MFATKEEVKTFKKELWNAFSLLTGVPSNKVYHIKTWRKYIDESKDIGLAFDYFMTIYGWEMLHEIQDMKKIDGRVLKQASDILSMSNRDKRFTEKVLLEAIEYVARKR